MEIPEIICRWQANDGHRTLVVLWSWGLAQKMDKRRKTRKTGINAESQTQPSVTVRV